MSRQMSLPFLAALAAAALTPRHSGAIAQRHKVWIIPDKAGLRLVAIWRETGGRRPLGRFHKVLFAGLRLGYLN